MSVALHAGAITAALLGLAAASLLLSRTKQGISIFYALVVLVAGSAALSAAYALLQGNFTTVSLPIGLPGTGARLRFDALASAFALIANLSIAITSLYAIGYGRHEETPLRVLPFYALFILGMNLVLVADDAFTFLVAWEFMSLSSWALVVVRHREAESRFAASFYLVMALIGALALIFAFGVLASGGDYLFDTMRAHKLGDGAAALVLFLTLAGAGSKSGLVPLHAWLPPAHAAAPSHVSALMSGVMTKIAVYGFIRIVFDLMGAPDSWWSIPVLLAASTSAVLGILHAMVQTDLKRLLAYSTIENIGIVYIGLGLALAFKSHGMTEAAALAVTAAIFHAFNHSTFKSLLFLGAGAVQHATHTRDIEKLGGLIHRMPKTALAFLVASVAISALPPLNGFVSEWMIFQAILLSPDLPEWGLKFLVPASGAMLALSAALVAACFVRAYGVVFLSRPRTSAAEKAEETDGFSLAGMFVFAALCLAAGILPGFVIDALAPAARQIIGGAMPPQASISLLNIVPVSESRSSYNGLMVFGFMVVAGFLSAFIIHALASNKTRRSPMWDCGYPGQGPAVQYTASAFAQPIRRVFGVVFRTRDIVEMPPPGDLRPARFKSEMSDPIWNLLYAPAMALVGYAGDRINFLQYLTIRSYLSFVFAALIGLLIVLAIWP